LRGREVNGKRNEGWEGGFGEEQIFLFAKLLLEVFD
jgi:hypothetical protein